MEDAKTYTELKPVFDELKKEKYHFTKAKEKYKAEHEGKLRRFYMVKRKLKEKGFEKEPFPLKAWQREFSELSAQREVEYQEYKLLQKDLTLLYQIKGDVDKAMRETHLEMLHPDKTKETETTLQAGGGTWVIRKNRLTVPIRSIWNNSYVHRVSK